MIDVNLLPEKDLDNRKNVKTKTYAILAVVIASVITALVAGGIFLYESYQQNQIQTLTTQKETDTAQIQAMSETATDLLTLKKKSKGIVAISDNNYDFRSAFDHISTLLPAGITMDSVSITNKGEVNLTVSSENINEVVSYIASTTEDLDLRNTLLNQLSLDETKVISFTLSSLYGEPTKDSVNN